MKSVSGRKIFLFAFISKKHLKIIKKQVNACVGDLLPLCPSGNFTSFGNQSSQLEIFSMLRECSSLIVTANVIVKRAY